MIHSVTAFPFFESDEYYHLATKLKNLKPRYVIMYDADIQFVRQVEVSGYHPSGHEVHVIV